MAWGSEASSAIRQRIPRTQLEGDDAATQPPPPPPPLNVFGISLEPVLDLCALKIIPFYFTISIHFKADSEYAIHNYFYCFIFLICTE